MNAPNAPATRTSSYTAYLRVSTDRQDEASQRQIIADYTTDKSVTVGEFVSDTESGGIAWQERAIAGVLERLHKGDTLLVSEVSRIARSTIGVLTFLQAATEKGVHVVAIRSGIVLDGSMQSKIVVTVLAMAAEIERDLIRERTRAALQARKAAGLPIGRQPGALGKSKKLAGKDEDIDRLVKAKVSMAAIARLMGVSRQTLHTHQLAREAEQAAAEAESEHAGASV
jgi:DNA invertase Pin-like site-specific DNA recombinase